MAIQFNPFVPSQRIGGPIFNPSFPFLSSTNECAPVSIYDAVGNLLQQVPSGGSYTTNSGTYYDLIFNLPAGGVLYDGFICNFKGTVTLASAPANVTSFSLRRLRGTSTTTVTTFPISLSVQPRDVLSLDVVPTSSALPVSFATKIAYAYDITTETTSITGGDGRYLWVVCRVDQTVHIVDKATGTSIVTTALTAGKDFMSGGYRPVDQCLYVFGDNYYNKIDLNPANIGTTFGTILTAAATVTSNLISGCCYDSDADKFYIGRASSSVWSFAPTTGVSTSITTWFDGFINATRINYLPTLKAIAASGGSVFSLASVADQFLMFTQVTPGTGITREFRGKIYQSRLVEAKVFSMTSPLMKLQATITNTAIYTGGIAFSRTLNRGYFCDAYTNKVVVVNMANNLTLGVISFAGLAGYGVRDVQYSFYNDLVYGQAAGEAAVGGRNRIYVFNPASGSFGAYVTFITVGNMDDSATYYQNSMGSNSVAQ